MVHISIWTMLWIAWGLMFVAIEGAAIFNKQTDDTLSEHFRKLFKTDGKKGRWAWIISFGVFASWFAVHIAVDGAA